LEQTAQSLGVSENIEFVGVKTGDELVRYFQLCDLYIHTPRVVEVYFEGFGIVYLEAGAAGKPVVAADAGGVVDAVKNGETGIIAPDGDVDAIAHAAIRDDHFAQMLGNGGKQYAETHRWGCIVDQFLLFYRGLMTR
jgi:glycosyltransferase involved in cell wall biosynthesis